MTNDEGSHEQYVLSDDQIREWATTNDGLFRGALDQAGALVRENADKDDSDHVSVPIGSVRQMHQALIAMYKTNRDALHVTGIPVVFAGDKGPHCDYNPFRGIDF